MNNTKITARTEVVKIIPEVDTKTDGSWQPVVGETTMGLGNKISPSRVSPQEWETIKEEAISVLSKCVSPKMPPEQKTGLVIGYVQSGKTLSYMTVAALARDNGYQMVIVIAGTSVNLLDQSTQRLEKDLNLHTLLDRKWVHFESDEFKEDSHVEIENALASWQDSMTSQQSCKPVLITAMKQYQHLEKLVHAFSKLNHSKIDLSKVPTLIIDDEADQASLNTLVQKEEMSTTYQRLLSLKGCFPHHTFLQYTATPQALLLINLIDALSPKFAEVLTPGLKYTGGIAFFQGAPDQICTIPDNEIPTKDNQFRFSPKSLREAMRIFLLGVAAGLNLDGGTGCRSMLIHPSRETIGHKQYHRWVKKVISNWQKILERQEGYERDYQDLLKRFSDSYSSLQSSVPELPSFKTLSTQLLPAIRDVKVHLVNSTSESTSSIPWHRAYAHILVGGQAMDRGFTVEGLTVTYMPRGKGIGNADTIQQRARFFGYKKDIFGYCRVFLEDGIRDAYERYIKHEEDVRQRLNQHNKAGKSLDKWKRAFFLDSELKPTRQYVLDIEYIRLRSRGQWYNSQAPHDPPDAIKANNFLVGKFCKKLLFEDDKGHSERTPPQIHSEATNVPLKDVYEELLRPFKLTQSVDLQEFYKVFLLIDAYFDSQPDALCTVLCMSRGEPRTRSLNDRNEIERLFQGKYEKNGKTIYPGDRSKRAHGCVTVQIHNLRLEGENGEIFQDVPTIAVWLPKNISLDLLVQNQGGT